MRRITARHQVYVARIGYFLAGFAVACWAPLIPIIQANLNLSTAKISTLVFSFGIGAVTGMFLAGLMLQYIGFKLTYAISAFTTTVSICLVAFMPSYEVVFISLIVFGASIGCLDVAINVFASYLESKYRVMLLSILYAYYSFGEVMGALMMMLLLTFAIPPSLSIICLITILYIVSAYYIPVIINIKSENKHENRSFARPRQPVISLALIVAFTYIVGGAMLDWSGLYITQDAGMPLNLASLGYCIVCACMLLGRIFAKPVINYFGPFKCIIYGAILAIVSMTIMVIMPNIYVLIPCFIGVGIGMANASPIATSAAGKQDKMPLVSAISLVSICGYTGLLFGPAVLGAIATFSSLKGIFVFLSIMTAFSAFLMFTCRNDLAKVAPRKIQTES